MRTALVLVLCAVNLVAARGREVAAAVAVTEPPDSSAALTDSVPLIESSEASAVPVQSPSDSAAHDQTPADSIIIAGIVIGSQSGEYPAGDSVTVHVDGRAVGVDGEGNFEVVVTVRDAVSVTVRARGHAPFRTIITPTTSRRHHFVTAVLQPAAAAEPPVPARTVPADTVDGPPWTITGAIVDSRLDLAIEAPSTLLTFDGDTVAVSKKGTFTVTARVGGRHRFTVRIPGYHDVVQEIVLEPERRQPFVVIGTTRAEHALTRREITVSASAEPVHRSAAMARTRIERTELQRTTATLGDPVRVLHTLPGVASESDASVRPLVRGGDLLEARVTLDGVSLIQPYHYGGARSTFNQAAMDNVLFYKTGFPARYQNAQSALIAAESRMPAEEPPSLDLDVNLLQFAGYLGLPFADGKAGVGLSAQSSFYQYLQKGMTWIVATLGDRDYLRRVIDEVNLPDYHDIAVGVQVKPTDKLSLYVGELYTSDGFTFLQGDSMVDVKYHYQRYEPSTGHYITFVTADTLPAGSPYGYWDYYTPGEMEDAHLDSITVGRPYWNLDTLMLYSSKYNVLYAKGRYTPDEHSVFTSTLSWQRRWWELNFPDVYAISSYFPDERFDVVINVVGGQVDWLFAGVDDHLLGAGVQVDVTVADYDVFLVRYLHEMIVSGSTNFDNIWGPVAGDTGMVVYPVWGVDDRYGYYTYSSAETLQERLVVNYRGHRRYAGGAIYLHDSWSTTPRLTIDAGLRVEATLADSSVGLSPRLGAAYSLAEKHELMASVGHYTQNNYDPPVLALADEPTPEKVWHGDLGLESRLLPWLTHKVNLYGKYYYDLLTEIIEPVEGLSDGDIEQLLTERFPPGSLDTLSAESLDRLIASYLLAETPFTTRYVSTGRGVAAGIEYFLRYTPADFWHGWLSLSYGRSYRRRDRGWSWHPFPFERPLGISLVNYYRMPRRYELGVKYRYMSGIPYTEVSYGDTTVIGPYNDKRYYGYHSLDWRFAKGFAGKRTRGHVYFEIWNSLNAPNLFLTDAKTRELQTLAFNIPTTVLFFGFDLEL